jgi:capsular exopolysaccharide synthesis family protein
MNQNQSQLGAPSSTVASSAHTVREAARFLSVVRSRKELVIVATSISLVLGGLYYATATRIFQSEASLLVLQTGQQKMMTTDMPGERTAKDLMPTYTSLFGSDVVLNDAIRQLSPQDRIDLADTPPAQWPRTLAENLSVSARRGTNILDISYRSRHPRTAAAVVDAVLSAYLKFMDGLHKNSSREILDILTKEKVELEEELDAKQRELLDARRNAEELAITEGNEGVNVVMRRAIDLNEAWIKALESRLEAESQLRSLQAAIARGEDLKQYTLAMVEGVGSEVLRRQLGMGAQDAYEIAQMNRGLVDDKAELRSLRQTYGPMHQKVREIEDRINVTEQYIQNRAQVQDVELRAMNNQLLAPTLLNMASQRLQQAEDHEGRIRSSYEAEKDHALSLDQNATHLQLVEYDLNRLRAFQDTMIERIKDIDLGQDNGMLRTEVLKHPEIPLGPVSPRLAKVGVLAAMLGLLAGLGIVYLQDLLDDRFRSPEDMEEQTGVPVLAMIRKLGQLEEGTGPENVHVHVAPNGADTESFRTLRTALAFTQGGVQRLVVSSTEPGDGKTTVTVNLAAVIAQSGKRTLLIDADMRRPGLTPLVGLRGQHGLSMILREKTPIAESVKANLHPSFLENLDVIPSGLRPVNPMELLASDRFADLLAWAEVAYDRIVVDSPPILAVSDAAIVGRLVDGVALVVRPEKNRRRLVVRAIESFPALGVTVLGTVINHVDAEKGQDYYGYGYGYGYSYSYGHDDDPQEETGTGESVHPRRVA